METCECGERIKLDDEPICVWCFDYRDVAKQRRLQWLSLREPDSEGYRLTPDQIAAEEQRLGLTKRDAPEGYVR